MVELGRLDRITSIVGERGTGKSTMAYLDALDAQADHGAYVIGHSPSGAIGARPGVEFHDGIKALDKGLRRDPQNMHIIASGASPEEVIEYARQLAAASRRKAIEDAGYRFQDHRPPPEGVAATPVHLVIDEGTHVEKYPSKKLKDPGTKFTVKTDARMEQFLTNARHEHVSVTWLTQAPTARTWTLFEQSNIFYVFRYSHQWGMNALRAAGIPDGGIEVSAIKAIPRLPDFQCVAWDKRNPGEWDVVELERD